MDLFSPEDIEKLGGSETFVWNFFRDLYLSRDLFKKLSIMTVYYSEI